MNYSDTAKPADSFEWNYLLCKDLKYPNAGDFLCLHLYSGGEVLMRDAKPSSVHAFCLNKGLTKNPSVDIATDIASLRAAGYLVEAHEDNLAFYAARIEYHKEASRRQADFKLALFEREGLADNPRAELCYSKAYERSHSKGLAEVANTFMDLAELIR